jgi:NAD+ synthetase
LSADTPLKIALAQLNPLIGDLSGNAVKIRGAIEDAARAKADLVVFPELVVMGYPPKDMLLKAGFVSRAVACVEQLAADCGAITALIGTAVPNQEPTGRALRNSVAVCRGGRIERFIHKTLLPTYDVFDERRYFEPANSPGLFDLDAGGRRWRVGVSICEDLGRRIYEQNPIDGLVKAGADVVVNASASPFWRGKQQLRERIFGELARQHRLPIGFANQVGGNDELIFDGASALYASDGALIARGAAFREDLLIAEIGNGRSGHLAPYPDDVDAVLDALVMGTADYVRKCGFDHVVLGLSGGIDSAVTAAVAQMALGPGRVHAVAMPSRYSARESLDDARSLAEALRTSLQVVGIEPLHVAFESGLAPLFGDRPANEAEENVQARIRGAIVMALSNKFGWLPLTTGNKSELAVGYCTLYGDMCGGLAVISDVPKTLVYQIARRINERLGMEAIPRSTIARAPSAELRPDQTDQDTLPPYELLDRVLQLYVEEALTADEVIARLQEEDAVFDEPAVRSIVRRVDRNEFKRKQAAPGLKVTSKAFGSGRRMPIAADYR